MTSWYSIVITQSNGVTLSFDERSYASGSTMFSGIFSVVSGSVTGLYDNLQPIATGYGNTDVLLPTSGRSYASADNKYPATSSGVIFLNNSSQHEWKFSTIGGIGFLTSYDSAHNATQLSVDINIVSLVTSPTFISVNPVTCFKIDTKILTDKGYILIQDLRKGALVKTLVHGFMPIDMIGRTDIYHPALQERIKDQLYKCSQPNYPEVIEELVITGCHSVLVDDFINEEQRNKVTEVNSNIYVTDKKYRLPVCADPRASVYETSGMYTIYHLALENDNYYTNYGIYANGLLVETCSKRYLRELSNMELIE